MPSRTIPHMAAPGGVPANLGPCEAEVRRKGSQRGRLVKRGDKYAAVFHRWVIKDGVRVWAKTTQTLDESTKKAAQNRLSDLVKEANAPNAVAKGTATLKEHVEARFLPLREATKAKGTYATDLSMWKHHIEPALGALRLQEILPEQVEYLLASMAKRGYGHGTLSYCRALLSAIWRNAKKNKYVTGGNPTLRQSNPGGTR